MSMTDKIALAAIAISVASLLVNVFFWRAASEANRLAGAANTTSERANEIAKEAASLGQTANSYASEANVVSHKSNDIAREALEITNKMFEAENVPILSVTIHVSFDLGEFMSLVEGANYVNKVPPAFEKPVPLFLMIVKNERKFSVTISNAGLVNAKTGAFIALPRRDVNEGHSFPSLPRELAGWQQVEIPVAVGDVKALLGVIGVEAEDQFLVRVSDAIDRHYDSPPQMAQPYVTGLGPFEIQVNFPPPVIVEQLGEEEFFPEGLIMPDSGRSSSG
jgi:hypothetical protein